MPGRCLKLLLNYYLSFIEWFYMVYKLLEVLCTPEHLQPQTLYDKYYKDSDTHVT